MKIPQSISNRSMIRLMDAADTDAVINIWLDASVMAHDFIDASYWQSKADDMRNIYLPSAITHVYENLGQILGFISMTDHYIAAIFVSPGSQGKGIGKQLIDFAKQQHNTLELSVYKANERSVAFYRKQGFREIHERIEEQTGQPEIVMKFEKKYG